MMSMVLLGFLTSLFLVFQINYYMIFSLYVLLLGSAQFMLSVDFEFNSLLSVFVLDNMGYCLTILSIWISFLNILSMFNTEAKESKMFLMLVNIQLTLLMLTFSMNNLFLFYFFFEAILIPIILMIFYWGYQPERIQAANYMLFYTLVGSLPLLVVMLLFYTKFSLSIVSFNYFLFDLNYFEQIFLVVAFLMKLPMFLFHLWLPKAHVEAPVAGSMMLAGVLLKLGGYGMYRVMVLFNSTFNNMVFLFISISMVGSFFISGLCFRQADVKSLIAYSSVSHMGMLIASIFSFSLMGWDGGLLLMLSHGLCSSGMFYLANIFYERFYSRNLFLLKGSMMFFPMMNFWWFMFCVFNMGAPPSMNLFSEMVLLVSLVKFNIFLAFILFFTMFNSAFYSIYFYSFLQHGKSWFTYSFFLPDLRDMKIMFAHFFPILIYFLKIELFMSWA